MNKKKSTSDYQQIKKLSPKEKQKKILELAKQNQERIDRENKFRKGVEKANEYLERMKRLLTPAPARALVNKSYRRLGDNGIETVPASVLPFKERISQFTSESYKKLKDAIENIRQQVEIGALKKASDAIDAITGETKGLTQPLLEKKEVSEKLPQG